MDIRQIPDYDASRIFWSAAHPCTVLIYHFHTLPFQQTSTHARCSISELKTFPKIFSNMFVSHK